MHFFSRPSLQGGGGGGGMLLALVFPFVHPATAVGIREAPPLPRSPRRRRRRRHRHGKCPEQRCLNGRVPVVAAAAAATVAAAAAAVPPTARAFFGGSSGPAPRSLVVLEDEHEGVVRRLPVPVPPLVLGPIAEAVVGLGGATMSAGGRGGGENGLKRLKKHWNHTAPYLCTVREKQVHFIKPFFAGKHQDFCGASPGAHLGHVEAEAEGSPGAR